LNCKSLCTTTDADQYQGTTIAHHGPLGQVHVGKKMFHTKVLQCKINKQLYNLKIAIINMEGI